MPSSVTALYTADSGASTSTTVPEPSVAKTAICQQDNIFCKDHPSPSATTSSHTYDDCDSGSKLNFSEVGDRRGVKRRWDEAELCAFNRAFKQCIVNKKMASGNEIMTVQQKDLPNRSVPQIRARLNNVILGKQKNFDSQL